MRNGVQTDGDKRRIFENIIALTELLEKVK